MLNKLDGKVIVDRELFRALYLLARNSDTGKLREEDVVTCRELWNQDLTGWAAVPVKQTQEMLDAGKGEYQMVLATFGNQYKLDAIGEAYRAMLIASPTLPGGGE